MEAAIFAVVIAFCISGFAAFVRWEIAKLRFVLDGLAAFVRREIVKIRFELENAIAEVDTTVSENAVNLEEIAGVLKEASRLKSQRVFDSDTIPDRQPNRVPYVSVAKRRAQAEAASLGPQSHKDQVRVNNAKAMEG